MNCTENIPILPAIGITSIGFIMGWLMRFFIRRFESYNTKSLGALAPFIAGGVVLGSYEPTSKTLIWFYPIGILIAFVVYTVLALISGAPADGVVFFAEREEENQDETLPEP